VNHARRTARRGAVLFSLLLVAAACGSDDDGGGASDTTAAPAETEAPAETSAPADTGGDTTAPGSEAPAGGGGADDERDGQGAVAFETAVNATADAPLVAEGEPFVLAMPNLEGDAGGTFPDVREGAEAAVKLINEQLGGIGADYEAGTPGRPIELRVCSHLLTQEEAQRCANEIVGENPNLIQIGVDFFTPLMYPVFQGIPTLQTLPIFVADFDQAGVYSGIGGCPTAFISAAQFMAEFQQFDKLAIPYANNAPGNQCWTDTQERFYQHYADQGVWEFQGFPDEPGDPSDNAALIQGVADFLEGAENPGVFFGVQSSDCVEFLKGLSAAGVDAGIVVSTACVDDTVLGLPESEGMFVELQGYNIADPASLTDFATFELGVREEAIAAYGPEAAVSTFMNDSFSTVIWGWQIANQVIADGGDPFDQATLLDALANLGSYHFLGRPPVDCAGAPEEYQSICYRDATYLQWNGTEYTTDTPLGTDYINVTELMEQVAESSPRQAS
jgi:branched-chain amino acid transport system substrate-binding protein